MIHEAAAGAANLRSERTRAQCSRLAAKAGISERTTRTHAAITINRASGGAALID